MGSVEDDTQSIDSHIVVGKMDVAVQSGTVHAAAYDGQAIHERYVWFTAVGVEVGTEKVVRVRGYIEPDAARKLGVNMIEAAGIAQNREAT